MQVVHAADSTNEVMVLGFLGELDLASVPAVRSAGLSLLADGWNRIVVDLTGVSFVDSAGLGVLIGLRRRCLAADGDCVLAVDDPDLIRLLATSEVDRVFRSFESAESATRSLRGART